MGNGDLLLFMKYLLIKNGFDIRTLKMRKMADIRHPLAKVPPISTGVSQYRDIQNEDVVVIMVPW